MSKIIRIKSIINKKNGQINFSLPRRKIPKRFKLKLKIKNPKEIKIRFEDLIFED